MARLACSARLRARHRLPRPRAHRARSPRAQDHALRRLQHGPPAVQHRRTLFREGPRKPAQVSERLRRSGWVVTPGIGFSGRRDTLAAALAARLGCLRIPVRHPAERGPDTIIELLFLQERAHRGRCVSASLLCREGVIPRRD